MQIELLTIKSNLALDMLSINRAVIFMQDNGQCHTRKFYILPFDENSIMIDWLDQSTDINPTEEVRKIMNARNNNIKTSINCGRV